MVSVEEATLALCRVHEERMLAKGARRLPVPVLLVSGALGSGKTTLLNHILHNKLNLRVTCLVNDLAALNVDASLLVSRDAAAKTVQLSNGCACHSLAGMLEDEMWSVLQETDGAERADYVVIETSGVVEPVSLVQSLERRHGRMTRARLDGVVVVVDADVLSHAIASASTEPNAGGAAIDDEEASARSRLIAAGGSTLWRQLQCADVVLLNKADLLTEATSAATKALAEAAAPWAAVHACCHGQLPLQLLMNIEYAQSAAAAGAPGHEAKLMGGGSFLTGAALRRPSEGMPDRQARLAQAAEAGGGGGGGGDAGGGGAGGVLPGAPTQAAPRSAWASGWASAPSRAEGSVLTGGMHGFSTLEFSAQAPLRLALFQDLLGAGGSAPTAAGARGAAAGLRPEYSGLLRRVARIKGVVWFGECRSQRFVFHLSGRQRVQLEYDGEWQGRPSVQLVAIGREWEGEAKRLRAALAGMLCSAPSALPPATDECEPCAPADGSVASDGASAEAEEAGRVRERLRADRRFELIDPAEAEAEAEAAGEATDETEARALKRRRTASGGASASRLIHFQLVGAALYGITRQQLERSHGIDVNGLNADFLQRLNSSLANAVDGEWHAKPCLSGAPLPAACTPAGLRCFTIRFAAGGVCRFEHVWRVVSEVADEVLAKAFARLKLCRCDV